MNEQKEENGLRLGSLKGAAAKEGEREKEKIIWIQKLIYTFMQPLIYSCISHLYTFMLFPQIPICCAYPLFYINKYPVRCTLSFYFISFGYTKIDWFQTIYILYLRTYVFIGIHTPAWRVVGVYMCVVLYALAKEWTTEPKHHQKNPERGTKNAALTAKRKPKNFHYKFILKCIKL